MNALSFTRNAVRTGTVVLMTGIVSVATADGFAQSYSGLYDWALHHRLTGWKAESFPLLVDLFILVGELGLFLLALDGHRLRRSFVAWVDILIPAAVASVGWLVSLWFNVNHIPNASGEDKVTAGVPPVTAMVGLLILLRTIHRYMAQLDERNDAQLVVPDSVPELTPEPVPAPEPEPLRGSVQGVPVPPWNPSGFIADMPQRARGTRRWALRRKADRPLTLVPIMLRPVAPAAPEPVKVDPFTSPDPVPEQRPEPTSNGRSTYGKGPGHPKWDLGVKLYRESLQSPGKALSQRDLAAALDMRNRSLAAAIIKHVTEE